MTLSNQFHVKYPETKTLFKTQNTVGSKSNAEVSPANLLV